ncbi:hypothetical protein [Bordetella petrii]|uniref:hypothetical protein n=1 Tax=Bordetella petrii TaxID=94624 RepID=UPI0037328A94
MTVHTRSGQRELRISVREARLIAERILLTCGAPAGYAAALRDTALASQGLGLSGLRGLASPQARAALAADLARLGDIREEIDAGRFDGAGLHAWCVAPLLADLLVAAMRKSGCPAVRVRHVREPAELMCVAPLAGQHGLRLDCEPHADGATLRPRWLDPLPGAWDTRDPLLAHGLRHGYPMPEDLWWELYAASNKALSPDSVASRRHAGPTIVQDDGTVIGRAPADDDTDLTLLRHPHAGAQGPDSLIAS